MSQTTPVVTLKSYGFLGFLTLLNVMNFVDRQLLASFSNFIVPDLGLSNTQFGLLTGLVFLTFYSVAGLFMGTLADRVNRTRFIAVGVALWSLLTAASGLAKGFLSLAAPRMLIGVGESILTPTSMSLLADRFPSNRLGFASGFYYMGVPIGVGVSLLIVGYIGPLIGWRNCFYLLGAIGLALAVVMYFLKDPERTSEANEAGPAAVSPGFLELLKVLMDALRASPALMLTICGGVAFHFILGAATFDQLWYVQERGFDKAEIAQITGWIGITAGIAGNLFGGLGGDYFLKKTGVGRPMFLFFVMLALAPVNIAYRLVEPDHWVFWLGVAAGFFQLGCFYGPTFATVQELVPEKIRATVVAFYILLLNMAGVAIGVSLAGIYIDYLIDIKSPEPYTQALLWFTVISLTAIPLFYFAGRRYEADKARLTPPALTDLKG
jgi:MFS transporter, Spinster family, sphingosine-1-phosphate transporter|tara:strand:+ start:261 stop:1571 length:1311 start_codon:yes stop_codon:yes gene_type:complete